MKLEKMKLNLIAPYWRNPRKNDDTVDMLMQSIVEYGFNVPITIDKDNVIITGHTRYKAVQKLMGTLDKKINELREKGHTKLADDLKQINEGYIFAIRNEELNAEQVRKFRIADNKIGEKSKWNDDYLKFELRELENVIGFKDGEIQSLLNGKALSDVYTNQDIKLAEELLEENMIALGKQDDLIEISCPYCNEVLSLSKKELLAKQNAMFKKQ